MARKRNAGEGSIFQRADSRWCGQIDLGWRDGKRARKFVYGRTAAEVRQADYQSAPRARPRDAASLWFKSDGAAFSC